MRKVPPTETHRSQQPPDAIALQYLFNHFYLSIKKKITFAVIQPAPYSEVNPSIDQFDEVCIA
ncbi:MAG: hypothetical protein ICV54_24445 [Nostoc sp. C3-bin3]|nr:hypothetical protein [Nostoc sp. C3-bin3]